MLLPIVVSIGLLVASAADASQQVRLKASFSPDRLGVSTTVHFAFSISSTTGEVPPPLSDVDVDLPGGMGLGTTDLGEATCDPTALFTFGPEGCSPNSRMGLGSATVEIAVEPEPIELSAEIIVYMATPEEEHTTMLFYAETKTPEYGQWVFPTQLLPGDGAYGADFHTTMPIIPTWPEGSPAVVIHMETSVGPGHLTYYARRHGKVVAYSPEGMAVPEHCPPRGFPFRATFRFDDGSTASATTSVPCPRAGKPRARHESIHHRAKSGARRRGWAWAG